MKQFIVSMYKEFSEGIREVDMKSFKDESRVINWIGALAVDENNPLEVERVFSVDEYGKVIYYEVIYVKGKLKLQKREITEEEANSDTESELSF